jgi:hypothetical protein
MSFDTSIIKNTEVYFPYDLTEGRIRKQCQDTMRALIDANTFSGVANFYERL